MQGRKLQLTELGKQSLRSFNARLFENHRRKRCAKRPGSKNSHKDANGVFEADWLTVTDST
jgi:hypothetical protein